MCHIMLNYSVRFPKMSSDGQMFYVAGKQQPSVVPCFIRKQQQLNNHLRLPFTAYFFVYAYIYIYIYIYLI